MRILDYKLIVKRRQYKELLVGVNDYRHIFMNTKSVQVY